MTNCACHDPVNLEHGIRCAKHMEAGQDLTRAQVDHLARAARELVEVLQVATHLQPVEREPYLTAIHRFLLAIEREVA